MKLGFILILLILCSCASNTGAKKRNLASEEKLKPAYYEDLNFKEIDEQVGKVIRYKAK